MAPLEWTRLDGDVVESLVSMFLCREHVKAFRVRPSQGDGGIDVCVPGQSGHVEIYQVKKFASNLGDNEKRQIIKSHERLRRFAKQEGWVVDRWYLTLPLDATNENLKWLRERVQSSGNFPCEWIGLSRIETWVSKYPDIVDYYLRDGRDRLGEEVAKFIALSGISIPGSSALTPREYADLIPSMVESKLAVLRDTLNQRDPHYSYDIAVGSAPAEPPRVTGAYPALIASTARSSGESCVTFHVLARCAESARERPVKINASFVARKGTPEHRDIEEFFKYGRVPSRPIEIQNYTADIPGGLGGSGSSGFARIGPSKDEPQTEKIFSIIAPDGAMLAEVEMLMGPLSVSLDGKGSSNKSVDKSGFLELEILSELHGEKILPTMRLVRKDLTGRYPDTIERSLAFLYHFRFPNILRVSSKRVRQQVAELEFPDDPQNEEYAQSNRIILLYVRALIEIQKYVNREIKVPNLDDEDESSIRNVIHVARILKGEAVRMSLGSVRLTLEPGASVPEGPISLTKHHELSAKVGGDVFNLGIVDITVEAPPAQVLTDPDGDRVIELVPSGGSIAAPVKWQGEESILEQSATSSDGLPAE